MVTRYFTIAGDSWANQEDVKIIAWVQRISDIGPSRIHNAAWCHLPGYVAHADLNEDGRLDGHDINGLLLALGGDAALSAFDTLNPGCDPLRADFNSDGQVDVFDFDIFTTMLAS
ncbi:MAG: hypothetical protein KKB50_06130 [Planctomycetes bacterium]|nr:hypothetical protein [Planctomycetota bacterium]